MRRLVAAMLLAAAVLSGCMDAPGTGGDRPCVTGSETPGTIVAAVRLPDDADGNASDFRAELWDQDAGDYTAETTTDDDGCASFADQASGSYEVLVEKDASDPQCGWSGSSEPFGHDAERVTGVTVEPRLNCA